MIYLVIALTIIGLGLWFGSNYKAVTDLRALINMAGSKVKEQLKLRHDGIEKFAGQVSNQLRKESDLISRLSGALSIARAQESELLAKREDAENDLGDCLGQLLQALQNDEQLAASDDYALMRDAILDIEDALTLARQDYNDLIARYNHKQRLVPVSLIADKIGIKPLEEFEIEDVFARYPLKIKGTLPTPRKSLLPGMDAPKESESPQAG